MPPHNPVLASSSASPKIVPGAIHLRGRPVVVDRCPDCGTELGDPFSMETKVIEEIPEPQPVIITECKIAHYTRPHCQKEVVATDPGCPKEGIFGNNVIAQAALLKYEDRLPHRKIRNALIRQYVVRLNTSLTLS